MTKQGEPHALSNFVHSPPILGAHWDPRPLDHGDDVAVDVKSYLNTL